MENCKIVILDKNDIFERPEFYYLMEAEKHEIYDRVTDNKSIIFGVQTGENITACCVIDFGSDYIHLREAGGAFMRYKVAIHSFISAIGKFYKKTKITIATTKTPLFVQKRLGFVFNGLDYEKRIA